MINCVKRFLKIDKNAACKVFLIEVAVDLLNNAEEGMISRIFFPETILVLIDEVLFVKETINLIEHNYLKDFADVRE